MKNVYAKKFEKAINKLSNLNNNEVYDITGGINVFTALLGTYGLVFGNTTLLVLSPLLLLTSFHCNFLMTNKI
ncbi:MAG: hypothetical protein CL624_06675 [Arcobacter sp.]|nr:hypothetical protein [Arcobacter sp.]|tara:strand:- start:791 stop:1009 length:219 start_codon:yes stop_codon:yes gene_type:complete